MTNPTSTEAADASLRAHANAASEQPAEWLRRKLATNDDTECAAGSDVGMPSCLCCGRVGKPQSWLMMHPETYVCETCWLAAHKARMASGEQPADTGVGPVAHVLVPLEPTPEMLEYAGTVTNYDAEAPDAQPDADHISWWKSMLAAAPPAIPHADQDKARNARSVGTGVVTDVMNELSELAIFLAERADVRDSETGPVPNDMRAMMVVEDCLSALESFAAHHAAEGAPKTGE